MKRFDLLPAIILILFSCLFWGCSSDPAANDEPGFVEGTVINVNTGELVEGITVNDGTDDVAVTNVMGFYSFQTDPGTYDLTFSGSGYINYVAYDVEVEPGETTTQDISISPVSIVEINGSIAGSVNWTNDNIYHINNSISINAVLTIEAGTTIKFKDNIGWMVEGNNGGEIVALGTSQQPIIFTSIHDDEYGGDTNGNGAATIPVRGDWQKIQIKGEENVSVFDHCLFTYGGSENDCVLLLDDATSVSITNSEIAMNSSTNGAIDASEAGVETVIQNNLIYNNVWPLQINLSIDLDNSNVFESPVNRSYGNDFDGIKVSGNMATGSVTWGENEIAYVLAMNEYDIPLGSSLTIGPGVVIKLEDASWEVDGDLIIDGTQTDPVYFTSYNDDDVLGDTFNNGNSADPQAGDWGFIKIRGAANNSAIDYCMFYYGGGDLARDYTLCLDNNTSISVTNCEFVNNKGMDDAVVDAGEAGAGTMIRYNKFFLNEKPLQINGSFSIDETNSFRNPQNYTQANTYNGIYVDMPGGICEIDGAITWAENEFGVCFVAMHEGISIETGNSLTLTENVVIKFLNCSLDYQGDNLISYDDDGVFFTSYYDDDHGDDTNGDGNATTPVDGDWLGIRNSSTSPDTWEDWDNILYSEF